MISWNTSSAVRFESGEVNSTVGSDNPNSDLKLCVRKKCDDNFVILKDGRYMTIIDITPNMTFTGFEVVPKPFRIERYTFEHIFVGKINRTRTIVFDLSDIDGPFSMFKNENNRCLIFKLFNIHIWRDWLFIFCLYILFVYFVCIFCFDILFRYFVWIFCLNILFVYLNRSFFAL